MFYFSLHRQYNLNGQRIQRKMDDEIIYAYYGVYETKDNVCLVIMIDYPKVKSVEH